MRRSSALLATTAIMVVIAIVLLRRGPVLQSLRPDVPLVVTLLPEPPPPPPPRVVPTLRPKPARPRAIAANTGGGSPRRAVHIFRSRATANVATADPLDVTLQRDAIPAAPVTAAAPSASVANTTGVPALPGAGAGVVVGGGSGAGAGTGAGIDRDKGMVLSRPDWVVKPSDAALDAFWPVEAGKAHRSGVSAIACRVQLSTQVHDCQLIAESPAERGFGTAAIAASRIFRVHPPRRNGKPIDEAWIAVTIVWTNPDPPLKAGATATQGASTEPPSPAGRARSAQP